MEKTVWSRTLTGWATSYYTELLWLVFALIALTAGIKYYRKEKSNQLFIFYLFSSLLIINPIRSFISISLKLKGLNHTIYTEIINIFFGFVEISTFFYFFSKIFNTKKINHILFTCWLIFLFVCVLFFLNSTKDTITKKQIIQNSYFVNSIEFLFLLSLCILYFYLLLTKETNKAIILTKSPSFWIISGLFFYCIVSLPFLLIGNSIFQDSHTLYFIIFSAHYISISILFLCIAKAFTCKVPLTT